MAWRPKGLEGSNSAATRAAKRARVVVENFIVKRVVERVVERVARNVCNSTRAGGRGIYSWQGGGGVGAVVARLEGSLKGGRWCKVVQNGVTLWGGVVSKWGVEQCVQTGSISRVKVLFLFLKVFPRLGLNLSCILLYLTHPHPPLKQASPKPIIKSLSLPNWRPAVSLRFSFCFSVIRLVLPVLLTQSTVLLLPL